MRLLPLLETTPQPRFLSFLTNCSPTEPPLQFEKGLVAILRKPHEIHKAQTLDVIVVTKGIYDLNQVHRCGLRKWYWGDPRSFFFFLYDEMNNISRKRGKGNSLEVQWLVLCTFIAKGLGSVPDQGTKIPQTALCSQKKREKKK